MPALAPHVGSLGCAGLRVCVGAWCGGFGIYAQRRCHTRAAPNGGDAHRFLGDDGPGRAGRRLQCGGRARDYVPPDKRRAAGLCRTGYPQPPGRKGGGRPACISDAQNGAHVRRRQWRDLLFTLPRAAAAGACCLYLYFRGWPALWPVQ